MNQRTTEHHGLSVHRDEVALSTPTAAEAGERTLVDDLFGPADVELPAEAGPSHESVAAPAARIEG
ncbi:MAG TPA: hypothetical protein VFS29_10155, partial [Motilibacteraceae bacterium]|nr:hypothetical protein [Motilibacteraceae bacterium]